MDQANEKPFPFLSLPGELREKIYSRLLVRHRILISYNQTLPSRQEPSTPSRPKPTPKGLVAITETSHDRSNDRISKDANATKTTFELTRPFASPTTISILLTSRQIHHEASFVLYAHNAFDFTTMPAVAPFLNLIGPRNRSLIRSIRLSSWNRLGWKLALNALAHVRSSELCIAVWKFDTYEAQWEVFLRELWEGLHGRVGNVTFCVGGGEVWERGKGNVLGSGDVVAVGSQRLGMIVRGDELVQST